MSQELKEVIQNIKADMDEQVESVQKCVDDLGNYGEIMDKKMQQVNNQVQEMKADRNAECNSLFRGFITSWLTHSLQHPMLQCPLDVLSPEYRPASNSSIMSPATLDMSSTIMTDNGTGDGNGAIPVMTSSSFPDTQETELDCVGENVFPYPPSPTKKRKLPTRRVSTKRQKTTPS
jgi:hypothetical protein